MMLMIESRTDTSLPYLVYTIKTINEVNPVMRKIHAKTHKDKEGTPAISNYCKFFIICIFRYVLFFFNFINE